MNIQLKRGIRDYVNDLPNKDCLSVTLTMKQGVEYDFLDNIKAYGNFKHFMNFLNKKIYGNAFKRFQKRISVVPVLERSSEGRLHFHLTLEKPQRIKQKDYEVMIVECWKKTKFGHRQIDIQNIYSDGWNDYITKLVRKEDAVDWENFYWDC